MQIARQVPAGDGLVIELGGGTGTVTQALLESGVTPERLIVVERAPAFVHHLRNRFPDVPVVHGDAARLAHFLPPDVRIDAIVSCLPLRSLPRHETAVIVEQWHQVLGENGVVIQFTYDIRPLRYIAAYHPDFVICSSRIVWANAPPARVVTTCKRATVASDRPVGAGHQHSRSAVEIKSRSQS
ncbi:methyltransferase [Paraburkholderia lacunae]|uniref:Methyltransferase n=2 Tax=Paraburkholderia lacunae TaxID=2211104 RepID=A0A370ND56_9BURK|nr:methyltransferase [Paraburkholderia lacunae]